MYVEICSKINHSREEFKESLIFQTFVAFEKMERIVKKNLIFLN